MGVGYCPEPREAMFHAVDYGNPDCVQGLLRFYHSFKTLAQKTMNKELICIYADLDRALENVNLTSKQREALHLYMEGWTEEEIGASLSINKSSVCRRISGGVKKVQIFLKRTATNTSDIDIYNENIRGGVYAT